MVLFKRLHIGFSPFREQVINQQGRGFFKHITMLRLITDIAVKR